VENGSVYYLQANTSRDQVYLKSIRAHPGALETSAGSLVVKVGTAQENRRVPGDEITILLPCDLPPRTAIRLPLPEVLAGPAHDQHGLTLRPCFHRSGEVLVMPVPPDLELARGRALDRIRK
jgi:hypothetical protein